MIEIVLDVFSDVFASNAKRSVRFSKTKDVSKKLIIYYRANSEFRFQAVSLIP